MDSSAENDPVYVQRVQLQPRIHHQEKWPWVATFAVLRSEKMQQKNVLAVHTATKIAVATVQIFLSFP